MAILSLYQLAIAALGGEDGGIKQTSVEGEETDLTCHVLQITDDVSFTALVGVDKDAAEVDMTDPAENNLDSLKAPSVICAPDLNKGGYIKTVHLSAGELTRITVSNTQRS